MKLKDAKAYFLSRLHGITDERELESMWRVVTDDVLHMDPVDVVMRDNEEVPSFFPAKLELMTRRLSQGEPLQYILGTARFHGHSFAVTPDVLIPRPETEQLVDMIVDSHHDCTDLRVLDIGTGSGCIAIALARALRFPRVTGIDISVKALAVARENARALKTQVQLTEADILAPGNTLPGPWDVIVSNPPYVCESERLFMQRQVLDYEPAQALFVPDDDPLKFYKAIARYAWHALAAGGWLYLEINRCFGEQVSQLLIDTGYRHVEVSSDFVGNPRFVTAATPND